MARNYGKGTRRYATGSITPTEGPAPAKAGDDDEDEEKGFPAPEPGENRGAYDKDTSARVLGRKTGDDSVYSPDIMPRNDETDI